MITSNVCDGSVDSRYIAAYPCHCPGLCTSTCVCRFFLEVLQHQKSTRAEWIIIFLIAAEMFIGIAGLVQSSSIVEGAAIV
jgi:hypothetical protein